MHVSASILACDVLDWKNILPQLQKCGVDSIHFDVMDGVYVDSITFGDKVCSEISKYCDLPIYVHLMTSLPEKQVKNFLTCRNVKGICFHPLNIDSAYDVIRQLKMANIQSGIAIANEREFDIFTDIADKVDFVTMMTVAPGKCGQTFDVERVKKLPKIREQIGNEKMLFVDGGINCNTCKICVEYAVNAVVVGSYLFGGKHANAVDCDRCLKLKYDG